MEMFGKLSQKFGLSQHDKDLTSELNDMQERYNALKITHDATLQMISKSKESDNSILEAYERLKKQFAELTLYISIKKADNAMKLKEQQEELSKRKDVLDAREAQICIREKELLLRSKCIDMMESGKR